ncbi:unnamed protein product [Bursaphelenchus xylophilus]|uniref:(pine wood nematode) hypothetical protein n=1 Tax=Bursaphelenchus xylophilus TaxID=6326 RepID=A0A1I7RPJ7_BURXY|nr:unnamed protein product [Bursaphelenchus xylophilus]CAG9096134.1 unnamed protein product [Bursaphelenchus xylophilus]
MMLPTECCPYGSHLVPAATMQLHVAQCRKNFLERNPNAEFIHCAYNPSHMFPSCEKDFHYAYCTTKAVISKDEEDNEKAPTLIDL